MSTFLASTTYHLLHAPQAYTKLKEEIRGRFKTYEEIDASSALQIPYIQATISEGLRIYPPGSQGFPRVSGGTTIDGHYVPQGVNSTPCFDPKPNAYLSNLGRGVHQRLDCNSR